MGKQVSIACSLLSFFIYFYFILFFFVFCVSFFTDGFNVLKFPIYK